MLNDQTNIPKWFAIYTPPKSEKKIHDKFQRIGAESFLPMREEIRQWSDRKKKVTVPLFPSYLFVRTTFKNRFKLFEIGQPVNFVMYNGQPAVIPDSDIETIKKVIAQDTKINNELFRGIIGDKVKITEGPFLGMTGVLTKQNGSQKLTIQIDSLRQAISVEIASEHVVAA